MVSATVSCMACGHTDDVSVPESQASAPLDHGVFECSECNARMAFGRLLPRIVVEPITTPHGYRLVRRRYQDPKTLADIYVVDVDPRHAGNEAINVLSLVI